MCSGKGSTMVSNGGPHMLPVTPPVTRSPGPQPTAPWHGCKLSRSSPCRAVMHHRKAWPQCGRAGHAHHPLLSPQLILPLPTVPVAERLGTDTLTPGKGPLSGVPLWGQDRPGIRCLSLPAGPGPQALQPLPTCGRAGDPPSHRAGTHIHIAGKLGPGAALGRFSPAAALHLPAWW